MIKVTAVDYMRYERKGFKIVRPNGSGNYLFLYFPKPMNLYDGENTVVTPKNACILFSPEREHHFHGEPVFVNTYIHFRINQPQTENLDNIVNKLFYPSDFERMNKIAFDVKNEFLSGMEYSGDMIDALMHELIVLIGRNLSPKNQNDPLHEQFKNIRHKLLSSYTEDISVSQLAAELCMSRASFYAHYKSYFNSSPKQDVLSMRMQMATVLLTNQNSTVTEIAEATGFKNVEHFTRYYKKYFGRPPRR